MNDIQWHPIAELKDRYVNSLLLRAPELVDLDCNEPGAGMGYWQDDSGWLACKWSMTSDEWREVPCTPTHYAVIGGAQ